MLKFENIPQSFNNKLNASYFTIFFCFRYLKNIYIPTMYLGIKTEVESNELHLLALL